jgi:hypothetical protein
VAMGFVKDNLKWDEAGALLPILESQPISRPGISVKWITAIRHSKREYLNHFPI